MFPIKVLYFNNLMSTNINLNVKNRSETSVLYLEHMTFIANK